MAWGLITWSLRCHYLGFSADVLLHWLLFNPFTRYSLTLGCSCVILFRLLALFLICFYHHFFFLIHNFFFNTLPFTMSCLIFHPQVFNIPSRFCSTPPNLFASVFLYLVWSCFAQFFTHFYLAFDTVSWFQNTTSCLTVHRFCFNIPPFR